MVLTEYWTFVVFLFVFLFVLLLHTIHTGWGDSHSNKIAQSRLEAWPEIKEKFISLSSSSLYMITLFNQIITGCFTVIHDDGERKWQSDEEWGAIFSTMPVSVWNSSSDSLSYITCKFEKVVKYLNIAQTSPFMWLSKLQKIFRLSFREIYILFCWKISYVKY